MKIVTLKETNTGNEVAEVLGRKWFGPTAPETKHINLANSRFANSDANLFLGRTLNFDSDNKYIGLLDFIYYTYSSKLTVYDVLMLDWKPIELNLDKDKIRRLSMLFKHLPIGIDTQTKQYLNDSLQTSLLMLEIYCTPSKQVNQPQTQKDQFSDYVINFYKQVYVKNLIQQTNLNIKYQQVLLEYAQQAIL